MDHQTPDWDWVRDDAIFFVTVCCRRKGFNQLCRTKIGAGTLEAIQHYHEWQKWFCHVALLMPDHVHFLLSFPDIPSFSPVVGNWKRWLTKKYGITWQENFFEHRVRKEEGFGEKFDYILQNPVRAGFVKERAEWLYIWVPERQ